MSEVFKAYVRGKGVEDYNFEKPSLRFTTIDDKLISHNDTPESMQLEDSCQIIAKRCIVLRVKHGYTEEEIQFRVNMSTKLSELFKAYANEKSVEESLLQFSLNGVNIQGSDTPLSLQLKDNDHIDVICTNQRAIEIQMKDKAGKISFVNSSLFSPLFNN